MAAKRYDNLSYSNRITVVRRFQMNFECLRILTSLLLSAIAASPAAAQAISISLTGTGTSAHSVLTATASGTLSPGGAVTAAIAGNASNDNCTNVLQFFVKMTLANNTDSLTILFTTPSPSFSATSTSATESGTTVVTAGTGAYAGKGGTGSATIAVQLTSLDGKAFSFTVTGTVTLAGALTPTATVTPNGITPVFSDNTYIQSGSWISIYGTNLANATSLWNGDFPTSLGGVTVSIDGKNGYLWLVSPGQINLQVPDDTTTSKCIPVVVNTPNGSITTSVDIEGGAPSFSLLGDNKHIAAVIPTPNGGGAYGGGTYDIAGPVGAFTYPTRPVKRGETVELFGVGFGPTSPQVQAGKAFSGAAKATVPTNIVFVDANGTPLAAQPNVSFSGLVGAGLFQINVTIPQNAPTGDVIVWGFVGTPNPSGNNIQTSTRVVAVLAIQ